MEFRSDRSGLGLEIEHVGVDESQVCQAIEEVYGPIRGEFKAWTRVDKNSKTYRTTTRGGPDWNLVQFRMTAEANMGKILKIERMQDVPVKDLHRRLSAGPQYIITILLYTNDTRLNSHQHQWKRNFNLQEAHRICKTTNSFQIVNQNSKRDDKRSICSRSQGDVHRYCTGITLRA